MFILLLILYLFPKVIELINYKCFWKRYFNVTCAGCGFTRMVSALFKFKIYQAFRFNPLFFILLIMMALYFIYVLISLSLKENYYKLNYKHVIILSIILFIYMILRNIPGLEFLKPTII